MFSSNVRGSGASVQRTSTPAVVSMRGELLRRLARIRGQVEGVRRMVEEERYCPDILQQLLAVRSALKSAQTLLLTGYVQDCTEQAVRAGHESRERARKELLSLFARHLA